MFDDCWDEKILEQEVRRMAYIRRKRMATHARRRGEQRPAAGSMEGRPAAKTKGKPSCHHHPRHRHPCYRNRHPRHRRLHLLRRRRVRVSPPALATTRPRDGPYRTIADNTRGRVQAATYAEEVRRTICLRMEVTAIRTTA